MASRAPGSPDLSKSTLSTEKESCDDTSYKPLRFFIAQSMPTPETTVLPSGLKVLSYCHSVLMGDMQLIEKARRENKDINVTSNNTPRCLLHYGMLAGVPEEEKYCNLKKLVDLGADREQRDEHGRTPLHLAVLLGDTKAVDVLLEAGCDTSAKCHGNNLIHLATISGDPDMFHKVRELGFDPCSSNEYGLTSELLALCYNQHQMIPLLMSCSLDVNKGSEISFSTNAFHQAKMPVGLPCFQSYALQKLKEMKYEKFGDVDIDELLMEDADFAVSVPDSPFSSITHVHIAAYMNRPEILQFALTHECKSSTSRPREPNILLLFSIYGSWVMNIISKAVPDIPPLFQVTEERQRAVVSAILDMPGCDPVEIMPSMNFRIVDAAVLFHQSTALSVMLDRVEVLNRLIPAISPHPMLHICVLSYALFQHFRKTDDSEKLYVSSLVVPSIGDFRNIFDVFLKHGFDINLVDSNDLTCLDIAMKVAMPEMESFLRSHRALTGEQLNAKKQNVELTERNEELVVENQALKLQNEYLSRIKDVFFRQLSPLAPFLNPGSNPLTQPIATPSTSVTNTSPARMLSMLLPTIPVTTISPSVPVSNNCIMSPPVPDTTPTNPQTTPTLHQLNQLMIRQIALDWYSVGVHLEIEVLTLKIIEADVYPPSVEKCCRTMFEKWLSHDEGTGGAPRIWRTVLKALKEAGYNTLVGDVERVLFEQDH